MILSDTATFQALDDGRLTITPEPQPRVPSLGTTSVPFDRTSVNLRLGETLRIPREGMAVAIDLSTGAAGPTLQTLYEARTIPDEGFVLDRNRFILGMTQESIRLAHWPGSGYSSTSLLRRSTQASKGISRLK